MKELSIEEKAKAYDIALQRTRKWYDSNTNEGFRGIFEDIFPELKVSEDEKVRKRIIALVNAHGQGMYKEEMLAWLEKQSGQEINDDEDILQRFSFYSYKDEPNILYLSGLYVNEKCRNKGIGTKILEVTNEVAKSLNCRAIRLKTKKNSNAERLYRAHGYNSLATEERDGIWLEKQCEQKPADKVEPDILIEESYQQQADDLIDMVTEKSSLSEEDKKLWVHDDDIFLDAAKMIVEDSPRKSYGGVHKKEIVPWFYSLKERLKSLKDKVRAQPKQEWSEEDEEALEVAIIALEDMYSEESPFDCYAGHHIPFDKAANQLKSLKERYTWKPSDEHYELEEFAKIVRGNLTGISKTVLELFEAKYLQLTGNKMYGGFKD